MLLELEMSFLLKAFEKYILINSNYLNELLKSKIAPSATPMAKLNAIINEVLSVLIPIASPNATPREAPIPIPFPVNFLLFSIILLKSSI
jgi:hypothetical protein